MAEPIEVERRCDVISHVSIDDSSEPSGTIVTAQFSDFDEFVSSYLPDLPGGGVLLKSEKTLPTGTPVKLTFTLASNGLSIIEGEGEIGEAVSSHGASSGMVIQFKNLQEKSKTLLASLVKNYL